MNKVFVFVNTLISEEGLKHHQNKESKIEEHMSEIAKRKASEGGSITDMVKQTQYTSVG